MYRYIVFQYSVLQSLENDRDICTYVEALGNLEMKHKLHLHSGTKR